MNEVMQFPATCPMCKEPGIQKMLDVRIPFFKEVIVMAFICDECGFKNSEIKSGGAIAPKGRRLTLRVKGAEDLARDLLKVRYSNYNSKNFIKIIICNEHYSSITSRELLAAPNNILYFVRLTNSLGTV